MTFCITSLCNANCRHCSSASSNDVTADLSTVQILDILDQLNDCGVMQLGISGGEPLLHPEFDKIIIEAKSLGFIIGVGTNGAVINENNIQRIKRLGIDKVQVSLDGNCSETHDIFRGCPGMFDAAINAIKMMVAAGITVTVCMTPTKMNYLELEPLIERCVEMGVKGFNLSQFVPVGRGTEELDLSPVEWKRILELWYEKKNKYAGKMYFTSHESQLILVDESVKEMRAFSGCQAGRGVSCIKSDGSVIPCVMLDINLGNVKEASFRSIWENSKILKNIRNKKCYHSPCGSCKYLSKCGGCRGVAYGMTGDYLAGDPRCWLHFNITHERVT